MPTASVKHVLRADLRSVILWALAALGATLVTAAGARAAITGGAVASGSSAASDTQSTTAGASAQPTTPSATGGAEPSSPQTTNKALATWFGPGFYGNTTACGQKLTPRLLGVASRKLPCGTLVQISYDGRQVTVPVIDRGPYGHIGAKWDLTAGTARALKVTETVRIATEIVGSLPNAPTLGEPAEANPERPPTEAGPTAAAASTGGAVAH